MMEEGRYLKLQDCEIKADRGLLARLLQTVIRIRASLSGREITFYKKPKGI